MSLLSEIESAILVMISQGKSVQRVRVPVHRRTELEFDMKRSQGVRPDEDRPMHVLGLLVAFEGNTVLIEEDVAPMP